MVTYFRSSVIVVALAVFSFFGGRDSFSADSQTDFPIAGQLDDVATSSATENQTEKVRITAKRAVHANLRDNAGSEVGTSGNPLRTDTTGTTTQPVSQVTSPWLTSRSWSLAFGTDSISSYTKDGSGNSITSTAGALNVNVTNSFAAGIADKTTFTYGTSIQNAIGGVFQDTSPTVTAGQGGALRMTAYRGLHSNLRDSSGTESATASNPLRTDPTGTTNQPVTQSGTWNINNVSGTVSLPTGASTSANQSTEITSIQILDDVPTSMNGAFVKGNPIMGQLDDTSTTVATEDNLAPVRITAQRAAHSNLRNAAGTEIGTISNPVYTAVDASSSSVIGVYDARFSSQAEVDFLDTLKTSQVTQVFGDVFLDAAGVDAERWATTIANSATANVVSGTLQLSSGVNVAGSVIVRSVPVSYYLNSTVQYMETNIRLGDTGGANSRRRWGAFDASDGYYFELTGTTFQVCYRKSTVDTCTSSLTTAFTVDTNLHLYSIYWDMRKVYFMVDHVVRHTISATTATLTLTPNLKISYESTNTGGSTTRLLQVHSASLNRLGRPNTESLVHSTTAVETKTLKIGPGKLQKIVVGDSASLSGTLTIYDNTAASGKQIAFFDLVQSMPGSSITFDAPFYTGLTYVTTGGNISVIFLWD